MNNERSRDRLSLRQYAAVMEEAKQRARELRREAISDFWQDFGQALRSAWQAARRRTGYEATASRSF